MLKTRSIGAFFISLLMVTVCSGLNAGLSHFPNNRVSTQWN